MSTQGMVIPKHSGRLGNVLFQAAQAMGYAWRHDLDYSLPTTTNDPQKNPIYLQDLVHPEFDSSLRINLIQEPHFHYSKLPFTSSMVDGKNIVFEGWWQSEKYFKAFRSEILEEFGFPWVSRAGTVSVHVRRGDYLRLMHRHPPVHREWYEAQMEKFPSYGFIVYSDDIDWCKKQWGHRCDVSFSEGNNELHDLIDGSCCEHHICSASTFSWWQAWLNRNPDKRVIFPKNWYQPGHGGFDTSDIWPEGCERA